MAIVKCVCPNRWQDGQYGDGMRVANKTAALRTHRCTACGKDIVKAMPKKKEKTDEKDANGKADKRRR